jgi:hypothetical protein
LGIVEEMQPWAARRVAAWPAIGAPGRETGFGRNESNNVARVDPVREYEHSSGKDLWTKSWSRSSSKSWGRSRTKSRGKSWGKDWGKGAGEIHQCLMTRRTVCERVQEMVVKELSREGLKDEG